jgi:hypothetical protein
MFGIIDMHGGAGASTSVTSAYVTAGRFGLAVRTLDGSAASLAPPADGVGRTVPTGHAGSIVGGMHNVSLGNTFRLARGTPFAIVVDSRGRTRADIDVRVNGRGCARARINRGQTVVIDRDAQGNQLVYEGGDSAFEVAVWPEVFDDSDLYNNNSNDLHLRTMMQRAPQTAATMTPTGLIILDSSKIPRYGMEADALISAAVASRQGHAAATEITLVDQANVARFSASIAESQRKFAAVAAAGRPAFFSGGGGGGVPALSSDPAGQHAAAAAPAASAPTHMADLFGTRPEQGLDAPVWTRPSDVVGAGRQPMDRMPAASSNKQCSVCQSVDVFSYCMRNDGVENAMSCRNCHNTWAIDPPPPPQQQQQQQQQARGGGSQSQRDLDAAFGTPFNTGPAAW